MWSLGLGSVPTVSVYIYTPSMHAVGLGSSGSPVLFAYLSYLEFLNYTLKQYTHKIFTELVIKNSLKSLRLNFRII